MNTTTTTFTPVTADKFIADRATERCALIASGDRAGLEAHHLQHWEQEEAALATRLFELFWEPGADSCSGYSMSMGRFPTETAAVAEIPGCLQDMLCQADDAYAGVPLLAGYWSVIEASAAGDTLCTVAYRMPPEGAAGPLLAGSIERLAGAASLLKEMAYCSDGTDAKAARLLASLQQAEAVLLTREGVDFTAQLEHIHALCRAAVRFADKAQGVAA